MWDRAQLSLSSPTRLLREDSSEASRRNIRTETSLPLGTKARALFGDVQFHSRGFGLQPELHAVGTTTLDNTECNKCQLMKGMGHYAGTLAQPENSDHFQHTYAHHLAPYTGDYYPTDSNRYGWTDFFHTSVLKNYRRRDHDTTLEASDYFNERDPMSSNSYSALTIYEITPPPPPRAARLFPRGAQQRDGELRVGFRGLVSAYRLLQGGSLLGALVGLSGGGRVPMRHYSGFAGEERMNSV